MKEIFSALKLILLGIIGFATFACSSSTVRLESSPEKAKVTLIQMGTNKRHELGVTPIADTEVPKEFQGMPVMVEFSHAGYATETILVPDFSGIKVEIKKNLVNLQAANVEDQVTRIQSMNEAIDKIFEAIRKVQVNKREEALKLLNDLKASHADISAIYEIEGNIYVMNNEYQKALESFNEALKYNPTQINSLQMKARLEKAVNSNRSPAQEKKDGAG